MSGFLPSTSPRFIQALFRGIISLGTFLKDYFVTENKLLLIKCVYQAKLIEAVMPKSSHVHNFVITSTMQHNKPETDDWLSGVYRKSD